MYDYTVHESLTCNRLDFLISLVNPRWKHMNPFFPPQEKCVLHEIRWQRENKIVKKNMKQNNHIKSIFSDWGGKIGKIMSKICRLVFGRS